MKTPQISVIMSVKNGSNELHKSIPSILNQTFDDFEFIICDDGSTDDTLRVLMEYKEKDDRIVVIHHNESRGLAYSLNLCIQQSKSNILARQDADDTSELNRFEVQLPFVLKHPEFAIVGTCFNTVDETGNYIKQCNLKEIPTAKDQINGGLFMHPSWMMRKDRIEKVGLYTVNKYTLRSQDYHLVMKLLGIGEKIYNMQIPLYNYTADSKMMARTRNWKRIKGLMWIRWDAYKRNKLPLWSYFYVLKPLIVMLLPAGIIIRQHKKSLNA